MDNDGNIREDLEEYLMIADQIFNSEQEGYKFYNDYAFAKGFSVRKGYVDRDSKTRSIIHRQFLCSRAGYRKEDAMDDMEDRVREPRSLTRCGCKAEFAISFHRKRGYWYVKKFQDMHNHPLARPGETGFLRSHRGLSDVQKAEALELKAGGLRTHQVMEVMVKQKGGFEDVGFTSKDLYNFFERKKKEQICQGDADYVIRYMQARQQNDMEYFFEYERNAEGCLKRLFWVDTQSRIDYDAFGEVVVFDSTYRVNRYNLPFIPFVGVNHHGSTVIFGCGVLSDETVESYEWLLRTFLMAMCQRHPTSLITDGDNSMRIAIQNVLPRSDHRLCIWHIEQNMIRHLHHDMLPDFRYLVYSRIGPRKFERKWTEFIEKFNVPDENNWISRMHRLRRKWAAAYTNGRVCLGMRSNQRSESLNSRLHTHLDRKMSLTDLVEHYEQCLSKMRHTEAELDSKASQSVPFTPRAASLFEKDAANVFTKKAFKKVRFEIRKSVDWEIRDIMDDNSSVHYLLLLTQPKEKIICVRTVLDGTSVTTIRCPCRKLECERIPCRHIFAVLHQRRLERLPDCCCCWSGSLGSASSSSLPTPSLPNRQQAAGGLVVHQGWPPATGGAGVAEDRGKNRLSGATHAKKNRKIKEGKRTSDDDYQDKKQCKSHRIWMEENNGEQHAMADKCAQADKHPEMAAVAKESEGTLPVYMKVVTPCNLRYGYMNIGKKFCMANGIVTNRLMIIKDSVGRSWPVKLTLTSDQARMKAGWGHIAGHHRIKVGDICVFHLVDPQTFNISIRQAQVEA